MGHPLIEEFCRAHELHPTFLRRCQRVFRDEIQPLLDERERLLVENAELKAQLAEFEADAEERAGPIRRQLEELEEHRESVRKRKKTEDAPV